MNEGKIDFSCLDPSQNSVTWEQRIALISSRALSSRQKSRNVWEQLVRWSRPALLVATAAACLVLGIATIAVLQRDIPPERLSGNEPAVALAGWAAGESLPSADQILGIMGGWYDEE
jgi:anti-sigma-K factor RskA